MGATVSSTVTVNDPEPGFPCVSVAEQVTVIVPKSGNVVPDAGEQVTGVEPSTLSFADAENFTAAPDTDVASAVIGVGTVTMGPVVSTTFTVRDADAVFPA